MYLKSKPLSLIIEMKFTTGKDIANVQASAEEGLKQIIRNGYGISLIKNHNTLFMGISFNEDKEVCIAHKTYEHNAIDEHNIYQAELIKAFDEEKNKENEKTAVNNL